MGSTVLSLRIDGELLDRLRQHAARRGMSVQDYVVRTLVRDDFDERFTAAVEETEKFYGDFEEEPDPDGGVRHSLTPPVT
ncbi:hypothetical protein [Streptomyces californicus]|uniref:hypothetical protein n=1 Tax=Streptomyces californicus TaxID=67351 RepID=UPI00379856ED